MNFLTGRQDNPTTPLARLGVALLCLVWLLAGAFGHDPWKTDDALHLGAAWNMDLDNWLVPRIAGDPWLVSPPLYHWLAALTGKLFGFLLPWHDGARMASVLSGAGLLIALHQTARRLHDPSTALAAPMLAIGTFGLLVPLHDALPAGAALAGFATALLGLAIWRDRPLAGGLIFGSGIGLSFLLGGLHNAALPLVTGLLLSIHPDWRRGSLLAWPVAAGIALLLALPWPWLLRQHSETLFDIWWTAELAGLFPYGSVSGNHFEQLAWASWPLLPLALWNLWLERRRLMQPQTMLPLVATLVALSAYISGAAQAQALLPALVPLALLAAAGASRLRRGAANAFDWFGMMTFTLLAALIWLGGIAMLTGEPARVAKNFSKPVPGFIPDVSVPIMLLAIAATVGWIAVMLRTPRSTWRAAARWSVGFTTAWILLVALWLPWIDYGKTYRSVSADFRAAIPKDTHCIARRGLGLAQRASLDYFDGIRTVPQARAKDCHFLIMQTTRGAAKDLAGWHLLMETSRPGDKSEHLRLYRR